MPSLHKDSTVFSKENDWFLPLFGELTVTNIAHFSVLSILTVHLATTLGFHPVETALVLLFTSIGLRFSRIVLAPFIDRFPPRRVIACAIVTSLIGYLGMMAATTVWPVAISMLLVGAGYGVNGMLVTTLASYTARHSRAAFPIYALMNSGTNLAAALAPPVSNWLRLDVSSHMPFVISALALCVSLLLTMRIHTDTPSDYRNLRFTQAVWPLLKHKHFLHVLALVAAGWAIYTQKFAAMPLFIDQALLSPAVIGAAIATNAVIVLLVSLPAAGVIRSRHIPGRTVLGASFALYATAYGLLAAIPTLSGLWISLALWSLGEALLMPQLNALVSEVTKAENRLAGFSLSAVAIGIGEASGNVGGVFLMSAALTAHSPWICYAALAAAAAVALFAALCLTQPDEVPNERTSPVAAS
jgi:DHA1 family multidrug resistance protein-like MFS transporter